MRLLPLRSTSAGRGATVVAIVLHCERIVLGFSPSAMPLVTDLDLPDFEYFDPTLPGPRLHRVLRELREKHWIARAPLGFLVLDRDVIQEILRDPVLAAPLRDVFQVIGITDETFLRRRVDEALESTSGETHARLRRLVNHGFGPRRIAELRETMRRRIAALTDDLAARRRFDFVPTYATKLPSMAIADLLGIPGEHARLERWSAEMTRMYALDDPGAASAVVAASNQTHAFVAEVVEARRRSPGDDVISVLAMASAEGDRLSNDECATLIVEMIQGGTHTTAAQLGHAMRLFLEHPDQWRLLAERPELAARATEEILRFEPSAPFNLRKMDRDRAYCGVTFPEGTLVWLSLASANRDPEAFADPDRFNVAAERRAEHLTFAAGRHYCLGASLARAEIEETLAALPRRFPSPAADGEMVYGPINGLYGMKRVPMRVSD
jgi:cytochrome P450